MKKLSWKKITTLLSVTALLSGAIPVSVEATTNQNTPSSKLVAPDIQSIEAIARGTDIDDGTGYSNVEEKNDVSGTESIHADLNSTSDSNSKQSDSEDSPSESTSNTEQVVSSDDASSSNVLQETENSNSFSDSSQHAQQTTEDTASSDILSTNEIASPEFSYFTITDENPTIYTDETFENKLEMTSHLSGMTFRVEGTTIDKDGKTFFKLVDKTENLVGFINAASGIPVNTPLGAELKAEGFASLLQESFKIWTSTDLSQEIEDVSPFKKKTYTIIKKYHHLNGETYYAIADGSNNFIGIINESEVSLTANPQGLYQTFNKYVSLSNQSYVIWRNFEWGVQSNTSNLFRKTFLAKGLYNHSDGSTYFSIYDSSDKWVGYAKALDFTVAPNQGGIWHKENLYVNKTASSYPLWGDFNFQNKKGNSLNLGNKTVRVTGKYYHFDGKTYYSLYDNKNQWLGYIDSKGVTGNTNQGGAWHKENLYINKKGSTYPLWNDLNFSKQKGDSNKLQNKTVKATGKYLHFNGSTYYSLYDNKNTWLGYINASGVSASTNAQGNFHSFQKYVSITKSAYPTWTSFAFQNKSKLPAQYLWTYKVNGVYYHYNGSTYFSLYDHNNKWRGYVNSDATTITNDSGGIWQSENLQRKIIKKDYPIWQDLSFKTKRSNTNDHYGKQYTVKGKYRHFNGSLYYSLYAGSKWIGYVNSGATGSPFTIYSTKNISKYQIINNSSGNFYSSADPSSSKKSVKSKYYKYMVRAIKEANTSDGTYYLVELAGSGTDLGWIKANQTYSVQDSFYMYQTGGPFPSLNVKDLNIRVSINNQRVYIRSGSNTIYTMMCSTGLPGTPTPLGSFKIQAERGPWFWGASGGAAYYRSFHGHGIYLFHTVTITGPGQVGSYYHPEAIKLGKRASHGCIRLAVADAIWFYNNIPNNTPVNIVN